MDIPRRNKLWLNTPAELAIRNAIAEIENLPANEKLTDAVVKLDEVRNIVADYVDENFDDLTSSNFIRNMEINTI